jgi:glycogen debranching enzyme
VDRVDEGGGERTVRHESNIAARRDQVKRPGALPRVTQVRGDLGRGARASRAVVKVGAEYYVLASTLVSRRTTRVLANAQSFAVFDIGGDIFDSPHESLGFFHRDTRYLSRFELTMAGHTPYLLNSSLGDDSAQLRVNLTNPDLFKRGGRFELPRNSIQMERSWVLANGELCHRLKIRNYAGVRVHLPLDLFFDVDFVDVFEVRGVKRKRHGELFEAKLGSREVRYGYRGLDGVQRFTEIVFHTIPARVGDGRAIFELNLEPDESVELDTTISSVCGDASSRDGDVRFASFDSALANRRTEIARSQALWARVSASNELFDSLLQHSAADLTSIITHTAERTFMMAGIPWFATLFGRDSIITALSLLPFNPQIAVRTLTALAGLQGTQVDEARDEQPGKIVHETRLGEMAATNEIPFGRYYGSVDSTPLFLWLLGRCVATTGDLELAERLWPNAERALEWIERWGDRDGDGYVEYMRETPRGLSNQGWKDSFDAISHANGELARPPIALAEVQGYLYAAYTTISDVARRLGRDGVAARLAERAAALKKSFVRDFWLERERTVALALDADKQPCRVIASNAAHCLAANLLDDDYATAVGERLMSDDMFSGWGVRTLSTAERRYNPMSYHNGSVWPHDNALAAIGLARYGNRAGAQRILHGLFDAAVHFGVRSLPELFCGFPREPRLAPAPYPVACHPQAWSAASVFAILQAIMGLQVFGFERRVVLDSPELPSWLESVTIEHLTVGDGAVSFRLKRLAEGAAVEVLEKSGSLSVEIKE